MKACSMPSRLTLAPRFFLSGREARALHCLAQRRWQQVDTLTFSVVAHGAPYPRSRRAFRSSR
jgi:hypothetical protein